MLFDQGVLDELWRMNKRQDLRAHHLGIFECADKYGLTELVEICEEMFETCLNVSNAIEYLTVADMHCRIHMVILSDFEGPLTIEGKFALHGISTDVIVRGKRLIWTQADIDDLQNAVTRRKPIITTLFKNSALAGSAEPTPNLTAVQLANNIKLTFTLADNTPNRLKIHKEEPFFSVTPYFNSERFSDVRFSVEGQTFFGHRLVLAARCPHFEKMFEHPVNQFILTGVAARDFSTVLRYLSTNELPNVPFLYQCLSFGMIVSSALMIWKGLMVVTGSESPIVVVLSGSMEPAFHRGDLLFLTNYQEDPVRVGEIVVFKVEGRDIPIVHRVLKLHEKINGTVKFLTKGDNNSVDDRGLYAPGQLWLTKKDVVGRARGFLPYVGMVTIYMNEYPKFKYAVLACLGLYVLVHRE